ncbi:MAG TPA: ATP synthase F1 subunit epsilon [Acidimicrobiales bacterium]|nr:ATP synthase F1 subunit epsilon [Acidimicrobiales bacterium]
MPLQVELVSPERILYSGEADMVIARTVGGGDIAFLPGHAPFVGALEIATLTVRSGTGDELVAVHGGFVEVSNDTVTVLSDVAELGSQIDVERARKAQDKAEERMRHNHDAEAEGAARRAHVRLAAAGSMTPGH